MTISLTTSPADIRTTRPCRTCEGRRGWRGSPIRLGPDGDYTRWHQCQYCLGSGFEPMTTEDRR